MPEPTRFEAISDPVILHGNEEIAYRDPCDPYHDGLFRVWHTEILGRSGTGSSTTRALAT